MDRNHCTTRKCAHITLGIELSAAQYTVLERMAAEMNEYFDTKYPGQPPSRLCASAMAQALLLQAIDAKVAEVQR